ncbi:MAG: hypothetical protein IKY66_06150 [Bacteroidales bacterium]|nr:hypothetical protein [Bacteroidales bacterium]
MRTLRYLTSLVLLMVTAFLTNAQTGSFLNIPTDTREMAMGVTNAGSDAQSVLTEDGGIAFDATYLMWSPGGVGSNMINAGFSYKLDKLAVLAEGKVNSYSSYPLYDGFGNLAGEYSPSEFAAGIGAAYSVMPDLGVSLIARYVGFNLADGVGSSAFCADLNLAYRYKTLTAGLSFENIGFGTIPMLMKAGVRNSFDFGESLCLEVGADAGYMTQGQFGAVVASAGVDLKIVDMVSVLAGYHFSSDSTFEPSYVSAGLGIDISVIRFSAVYLLGNPHVGNTLGFTLGCRF